MVRAGKKTRAAVKKPTSAAEKCPKSQRTIAAPRKPPPKFPA
jgi:hypothetical protein